MIIKDFERYPGDEVLRKEEFLKLIKPLNESNDSSFTVRTFEERNLQEISKQLAKLIEQVYIHSKKVNELKEQYLKRVKIEEVQMFLDEQGKGWVDIGDIEFLLEKH